MSMCTPKRSQRDTSKIPIGAELDRAVAEALGEPAGDPSAYSTEWPAARALAVKLKALGFAASWITLSRDSPWECCVFCCEWSRTGKGDDLPEALARAALSALIELRRIRGGGL